MKGVSSLLLTVTSSTAKDFVFSGSQFFSAASLRRGWVCVGDGAIVRLNNGTAGVDELWTYVMDR